MRERRGSVLERMQRGFTLVELMIVVAILGVLSVVAITGYRKYVYSARNSEAVQFLGAVRAAQEAYFQSFGQYCGGLKPEVYPDEIPHPDERRPRWDPDEGAWRDLGVRTTGNLWFQYTLIAGRAGDSGGPAINNGQAALRPWFVARANGDFDADGRGISTFEVTSETPNVFIRNENE